VGTPATTCLSSPAVPVLAAAVLDPAPADPLLGLELDERLLPQAETLTATAASAAAAPNLGRSHFNDCNTEILSLS
jgi:hypothetical protein